MVDHQFSNCKTKEKKKPDLFRFISHLNKQKNERADLFGYTVIVVSLVYYLVIESYLSAKRNIPVRRSPNVCSIVLTLEGLLNIVFNTYFMDVREGRDDVILHCSSFVFAK